MCWEGEWVILLWYGVVSTYPTLVSVVRGCGWLISRFGTFCARSGWERRCRLTGSFTGGSDAARKGKRYQEKDMRVPRWRELRDVQGNRFVQRWKFQELDFLCLKAGGWAKFSRLYHMNLPAILPPLLHALFQGLAAWFCSPVALARYSTAIRHFCWQATRSFSLRTTHRRGSDLLPSTYIPWASPDMEQSVSEAVAGNKRSVSISMRCILALDNPSAVQVSLCNVHQEVKGTRGFAAHPPRKKNDFTGRVTRVWRRVRRARRWWGARQDRERGRWGAREGRKM